MAAANTALFVDEDAGLSVRHNMPKGIPAAGELLISTSYSGVNPADIKHATELGVTDTVMGYDFCGKVVDSHSPDFTNGDVVAGYTPTGLGRDPKYGTHQDILVCPADMAFHVPDNLPQSHAACLTVVAMTAADAVFNLIGLALPNASPQVDPSFHFLIWGASSSVGVCALQFARAAGVRNITAVASSKYHGMLQGLGASACFDHHSPDIVQDVRDQCNVRGPFTAALDAAGTVGLANSGEMTIKCCPVETKLVSVVVRPEERFSMPLAVRNADVTFFVRHLSRQVTLPANAAAHWRAWKALLWALDNYGKSFVLPSVSEHSGPPEEWLLVMKRVAEGRAGFGKISLSHREGRASLLR